MTAISTKNLVKKFNGVRALDDLDLEFKKGQITGLIGPNGSGKSTLVNILSGLFSPDSGAIVINGFKRKRINPLDNPVYSLTRTFQEVRLFNQMTVEDNLLVVLTERNVFSALFEKHTKYHLEKTKEILDKLGLKEKAHELAANLSYGQRKLLEIGRALAMNAEIYLFDEPFAGLFPEMRKIVIKILQELKGNGKTIILIEHSMDLIRELSDEVIVLDSGTLLASGQPDKVLEEKKVIEAYLGE